MIKRKETNRIVYHHSFANKSDAATIRKWHLMRKDQGYEDIGYHFVILRDGIVENGRSLNLVGAHAKGKNIDSIGICLEGDFFKYEPSVKQLGACQALYKYLCSRYKKELPVEFHRKKDLKNACPGPLLNRDDFLEIMYRATIGLNL